MVRQARCYGGVWTTDQHIGRPRQRAYQGTHWLADDRQFSVADMNNVAMALDGYFANRLSQIYPVIGWDETARRPCYAREVMAMEALWEMTSDPEQVVWMFQHLIEILVGSIRHHLPPERYPILGYRTPMGRQGEADVQHVVLASRPGLARWRGDFIMPPIRVTRADMGGWEAVFGIVVYAKGRT